MPTISIALPESGVVGDIKAAFIQSGFIHLDSSEIAELILDGGVFLKYSIKKYKESGIDPEILVRELRLAGLVVKWSSEKA